MSRIISFLLKSIRIMLYFFGTLFILLLLFILSDIQFFLSDRISEYGSTGGKVNSDSFLAKKLKENNIFIDEENEINIKKIIIKEDGKEITIEIKE